MRVYIAVLLSLWGCMAAARASESQALPGVEATAVPVERLIAQLASPDYITRETATTELMVRDDLDDATLKAAFETAGSPEQTHRLTRIALHRFYRRMEPPRTAAQDGQGGLGVAISGGPARVVRRHQNPQLPNPAFLVTERLPGFPAYAYLRTGDLILAIGGQGFDDDFDFSRLIQQYRAGETVTFRIVRDGRTVEVSFPLDSLGRLSAVYQDGPQGEAWAMSRPEFQRYLASLKGGTKVAASLELRTPAAMPTQSASASRDSNTSVQ